MATCSYQNTEESSVSSSFNYHRHFLVDKINSGVPGVRLPKYSKINSVTAKMSAKRSGVNLSTSNTDARIYFYNEADANDGVEVGWWENQIGTSYKEFSCDITKYCISQAANSGAISKSTINNYSRLYFASIGVSLRTHYINHMGVHYDYTPPTYTLSLKTSGSGSVSGGGTFNVAVTDQTKTITATPSTGYKFVKWVDSKGNTYTTPSVNVTISQNNISAFSTTVTYTAYFELDKINKIYVGTAQPKAIYVGTQEVKAVYVGTTKVYG